MSIELLRSAFFWGLISAVSLPLGALLGLLTRPPRKVTSVLMAFGAGALLFALTIELFSESLHLSRESGNSIIYITIAGALAGGLLFDLLNQLLNNRGAFLRKFVTTRKHLVRMKRKMARALVNELSRVRLLQSLPPDDIATLIPNMKRETFDAGEVIFRQDDLGSTLYFIVSGEIEILRRDESGDEKTVAVLSDNDTFGEMALLGSSPRNATARAKTRTNVLKALHSDFETALAQSDALRESALVLFHQRAENLSQKAKDYSAEEWESRCLKRLQRLSIPVSEQEINEESQKAMLGKGAAMAIWLGILLDGIPESLIIGILSASVTGISLAFITGVFLANLPEAMSSAVGMKKSGMSFSTILLMWGSLCLITGAGAGIGVLLFPPSTGKSSYMLLSGIEGLAAGAMLTMIAETMLPEAFEQGGAIVGFSTLLGFLTALLVKVF
ncbi:MAG: cyclic nucleotide-binding domain-containing protein [Spirochaetales bacterium]|nr:cyclic nucleotide-binding domain-containing protein [Spirochaetales bacterium]